MNMVASSNVKRRSGVFWLDSLDCFKWYTSHLVESEIWHNPSLSQVNSLRFRRPPCFGMVLKQLNLSTSYVF